MLAWAWISSSINDKCPSGSENHFEVCAWPCSKWVQKEKSEPRLTHLFPSRGSQCYPVPLMVTPQYHPHYALPIFLSINQHACSISLSYSYSPLQTTVLYFTGPAINFLLHVLVPKLNWIFFVFFFGFLLQCCANFCCAAECPSHINSFSPIIFHHSLSQETGQSPLCCTVGPHCSSISNVIIRIYFNTNSNSSPATPISLYCILFLFIA